MSRMFPADFHVVDVSVERYEEWLEYSLGTFGHVLGDDPEVIAFLGAMYPPNRSIAVVDGSGYVATASAIELDVVLPGGYVVGMAGVTLVTVDPTVTRRGVLTTMMQHIHRRAAEEGKPLAGLVPTEWPIYGRFGYGPATWFDSLIVDVERVRWRGDVPGLDISPRRTSGKEARELAYSINQNASVVTAGEVLFPSCYWDRLTMGASSLRLDSLFGLGGSAMGPRRCVAVEDLGLASYRVSSGWTAHGAANGILKVSDLLAVGAPAAAALWRHLFSVDLVAKVKVPQVPVDEPLRWWVVDPSCLQPLRHHGLWLRPLDVVSVLEAREWSGRGALTILVHDTEGYADGTFRLEVDDGGATCRRSSAKPDLEMEVAVLGAILLGGTSATELQQSGRIRSANAHAAQLWDSLAMPPRAPFLSYSF